MSRIDPNSIRSRHRDLEVALAEGASPDDELRITVAGAHAKTLLSRLSSEDGTAARRLVDLTVIDRGPASATAARFEVVYRLFSAAHQASLRVHALVADDPPAIESVTALWPAAGWLEREAWDLFGVQFRGHPDLRRILLDAGFEGAPLRKNPIGEDASRRDAKRADATASGAA